MKSVHLNLDSVYYFENIFFSVPKESIIDSQNPNFSEINKQCNNRLILFAIIFSSPKNSPDFSDLS